MIDAMRLANFGGGKERSNGDGRAKRAEIRVNRGEYDRWR